MPKKNTKSVRRKPWTPGKQAIPAEVAKDLGLDGRRLNHGDFEAESVGIGHHRLREKSPLTHPALLSEMQAMKTKSYIEAGKELPEEGVCITQTPSDRATAQNRKVLWDYIFTRIEAQVGKQNGINYEGSPRSGDLHRLPLTDRQFNRRAFMQWLKGQPGWKYFTSYLDSFVALVEPQSVVDRDRIMSKGEIGMWLIDCDNTRDGKNAADGALAAICNGLAEAAADFSVVNRRLTNKR